MHFISSTPTTHESHTQAVDNSLSAWYCEGMNRKERRIQASKQRKLVRKLVKVMERRRLVVVNGQKSVG